MEARKITIFESKNQKKSVIMSAATTLAELKNDLTRNGISYENMAFFEGVSKTELKEDSSVLPQNVPYKGTTTNELVFMLTNASKHIASGADRAEVLANIKALNLQDVCKERFGKAYTNCKTDVLESLLNEFAAANTVDTKESKSSTTHSQVVEAIRILTNILYQEGYLDQEDKNSVLSHIAAKEESPYSDTEISEMFEFLD